MKKFFLISLLFLSACSSILKEPPETAQTISSPMPTMEEGQVTRTLGSLWSSNSAWNNLYSATTSRVEGDLLEIQLGTTVKARIDSLRKKLLKEKYGDENYEAPKKRDEGLIAGGEAAGDAPKRPSIDPLPSTIQAVIKEVGTRGLYRVSAFETLKVGEEEPRLYVEGLVRDRDIDADDKFSSDSLYGVRIELRPQSLSAVQENKVVSSGGSSNVSW